jgi:hypothetical protein
MLYYTLLHLLMQLIPAVDGHIRGSMHWTWACVAVPLCCVVLCCGDSDEPASQASLCIHWWQLGGATYANETHVSPFSQPQRLPYGSLEAAGKDLHSLYTLPSTTTIDC